MPLTAMPDLTKASNTCALFEIIPKALAYVLDGIHSQRVDSKLLNKVGDPSVQDCNHSW